MNKLIPVVFIWFCVVTMAQAKELVGVNLQQLVYIDGLDSPLKLNGAGIRYKFIFKIYVGALYLEKKINDPNEILTNPGPSRVIMHIVYDEVPSEKLVAAWLEGF